MSSAQRESRGPLLLFDAECVLCTRTAWFIDRRDRRRTLKLESLRGPVGVAVAARHPQLAAVDSLVWVESDPDGGERVRIYSDAVLEVGRYLGGSWGMFAGVCRLVPRVVRDAMYRWLARHRHSVTGR